MNIDSIQNGIVIDHIPAGRGMQLYDLLHLDALDCAVALIKNAHSNKSGKKDIIKIDNILNIDYSVLGYLDPNITVNVIQDSKITKKIKMELPDKIQGVIECKNPRCITATEHYVPQEFHLVNRDKAQYRCIYCDALYSAGTIGAFEGD